MNQHSPSSLLPDGPPAPGSPPVTRRPSGLTAPAPPLARLIRVELRKLVDTVAGRWLLVVTGVLVLGALGVSVASASDTGIDLFSLLRNALVPVALLLPVMGVLLVSGEFATRSVLVTFTLVPSRGRVVAAKAAAAVVLAVVVTVVTGLLAAAAAGGLELSGESVRWSVEPAVLGQLLAFQLINVLVGFGFGLLFQSTALGVVAYLVVPTLIGFVVVLMPSSGDLAPWLDLAAGTEPLLLDSVADAGQWLHAASVTAVWAGVPSVFGWLRLRHREIA
jgi:ABC-2 type transport system permease protein